MLKLLYFAIFISLTALLACSSPEKSPPPTAVAQAPAAESILDPDAPVETPPGAGRKPNPDRSYNHRPVEETRK